MFDCTMPPLLMSTPAMPCRWSATVATGRSSMARTSITATEAGASSAFSSRRDAEVTTGFSSTTRSLSWTSAVAVPPALTVTLAIVAGENPIRVTSTV